MRFSGAPEKRGILTPEEAEVIFKGNQRITGHHSKAVFAHYADHVIDENLEEVGRIGAEVFGNILQFPRAV